MHCARTSLSTTLWTLITPNPFRIYFGIWTDRRCEKQDEPEVAQGDPVRPREVGFGLPQSKQRVQDLYVVGRGCVPVFTDLSTPVTLGHVYYFFRNMDPPCWPPGSFRSRRASARRRRRNSLGSRIAAFLAIDDGVIHFPADISESSEILGIKWSCPQENGSSVNAWAYRRFRGFARTPEEGSSTCLDKGGASIPPHPALLYMRSQYG